MNAAPAGSRLAGGVAAAALVVTALGVTGFVACSPRRPPAQPPSATAVGTPLVFVPGVMGSALREADGGEIRYGRGLDFVRPRDQGRGIALPVPGSSLPAVESYAVLRRVRLGPIVKPVYGPLVDALVRAGYREGVAERPAATDTLFLFHYDWREDNVDTARALAALLERIRAARGVDSLAIDLLCQSNGAHICRWAAKYGVAHLAEVERGVEARRTAGASVGRLLLVGASNGGALRVLREMNRGRRPLGPLGRVFHAESFFAMESLYQDLPFTDTEPFVDIEGRPLDVDLYDPDSWLSYGWSIFDPAAARRADAAPDHYGTREDRRTLLADLLDRAVRFHTALGRDPDSYRSPPIHLFENGGKPTPVGAVLERVTDGWRTHFPGDRWLRRRPQLAENLTADGDGHATLESQRAFSPAERTALAPPYPLDGPHFETILRPETHELVLEVLADTQAD